MHFYNNQPVSLTRRIALTKRWRCHHWRPSRGRVTHTSLPFLLVHLCPDPRDRPIRQT